MFLKAYRVKSNIQMKGSDKKKFKAELRKKFPLLTEERLNELLPTKDEVVLSKIYTFNGDSVLVYTHQKNPLFFELEKDKVIFPTVYTLWKYPDLLPSFPTWPLVLPKIANGADLMIPGIVVDYERGDKAYLNGKLKRDDAVYVNLTNNRAAVAVGVSYHSSEDLYMAGRRGKGLKILHFAGDKLWESGSKVPLPTMNPPDGLDFINHTEENQYVSDDENDPAEEIESVQDDRVEEVVEGAKDLQVQDVPEVEEDPRSPQEIMDELLENAFLQAWKTSAKKAELPMLTSNFFRVHMVSQCPKGKSLDVKKSSYKKLSKFLSEKSKEGLITVKELTKGVESITDVKRDHEKIQHFRVIKVVKDEEPEEEVLPCDMKYEPPEITELFIVSGPVQAIFKPLGIPKGRGLTGPQVREEVKRYVLENDMQDPERKSLVKLNPEMAGVVLGKGENGVFSLKWDDLHSRIQAKMSNGFSLRFPGEAESKVSKGALEPIEITTATRSGNKKVTLVHRLELFRISPKEFAQKLQVGVAASTSVHEAPNQKPGAVEVLVQGNQTSFISKLLLQEYKIPRKYVKEQEVVKKKKGKNPPK
ncbi:hypothetical protein TCAL_00197 [Tigriopus californicus]|uniref:SUI1 domain-containing protein n=1 Tax=Tigriopus californicus TaxID=6832 RepID=A0A553P4I6_TIGCA|nr:eukaryotic translation initiation factor 2D-like [Tigriopus californicus]TRY72572.1 hypothetical protein TCAL_00197 [Tigriopus californicus]